MPAARPSQASVSNAVAAVVAAGLTPVAIHVKPDGSFQIELAVQGVSIEHPVQAASDPLETHRDEDKALAWSDIDKN